MRDVGIRSRPKDGIEDDHLRFTEAPDLTSAERRANDVGDAEAIGARKRADVAFPGNPPITGADHPEARVLRLHAVDLLADGEDHSRQWPP